MKRLSILSLLVAFSLSAMNGYATSVSLTTSSTANTSCSTFDGTATVVATGGGGSYAYNWSNGNNTATSTGLAPGTYSVTVNDAADRTNIATATVAVSGAGIVMQHTVTNVDCNNALLGAITVSTFTAAAPYNVTWRGTNNYSANTISINNLKAGAYTVAVTDANSCVTSATYLVHNTGAITFTHSTTAASCTNVIDGGFTLISQSIAVNPVSYRWAGPNGFKVNNLGTLTNAPAGNYTVSVADANGCKGTGSYNIPLTGGCSINTWSGAVSTAWANPGNWELGVPVATDDVYIPKGCTQYPVLSAATSVNSVFVQAGGSVTLSAPINVNGNWTNYGSAAIGAATVTLAGTVVPQGTGIVNNTPTIKGYSVFNNLEITGNYNICSTVAVPIAASP